MTENLIECVVDVDTSATETYLVNMVDTTYKTYFEGLTKGTYNYIIDLSTLNWGVYGTNRFYAGLNPRGLNSNLTSLCLAYQKEPNNLDNASMVDKSYSIKGTYMVICDSSFSSVDDFKNSLSGDMLIYELNTPITPLISESDFNSLLNYFDIDGWCFEYTFGETVTSGATIEAVSGTLIRSDTTTKSLGGHLIRALSENNIFASTGDVSVKYLLTVGKAVNV
jgi:hypothetical protein